jgi:hypothetical protein
MTAFASDSPLDLIDSSECDIIELSSDRIITLDRAASLRAGWDQDVSAPRAVLSLAFPGPSSRDRFSSLRRSNAIDFLS